MELVDTITDLVGRPVMHEFGPGLKGVCHHGILQAATYVANSTAAPLRQALAAHPDYDILVTGGWGAMWVHVGGSMGPVVASSFVCRQQ